MSYIQTLESIDWGMVLDSMQSQFFEVRAKELVVGQERIFIGYFDSEMQPLQIVSLLKRHCASVAKIEVHRKLIGTTGKVYCCCMQFDSMVAAKQAMLRLQPVMIRGNHLLVRRWVERTAANERRDIHWRGCGFHGLDKRDRERRNYRSLKYVYNHLQKRTNVSPLAEKKAPANPSNVLFGFGAGIEVSIVPDDRIVCKTNKLI